MLEDRLNELKAFIFLMFADVICILSILLSEAV